MAPAFGSLVIDEWIFPVTGVRLTGGKVRIAAEIEGPTPEISLNTYVVQGDDGRTVYQSSRGESIPPVEEGWTMTIILDLEMEGLVRPAGPILIT
ncbi:MAG TPA: hypothetical protein VFI12_04680 [Thermomicrobiales bacterium]|nr:hypothetical protein [Thermomicrobiales bacterium]